MAHTLQQTLIIPALRHDPPLSRLLQLVFTPAAPAVLGLHFVLRLLVTLERTQQDASTRLCVRPCSPLVSEDYKIGPSPAGRLFFT